MQCVCNSLLSNFPRCGYTYVCQVLKILSKSYCIVALRLQTRWACRSCRLSWCVALSPIWRRFVKNLFGENVCERVLWTYYFVWDSCRTLTSTQFYTVLWCESFQETCVVHSSCCDMGMGSEIKEEKQKYTRLVSYVHCMFLRTWLTQWLLRLVSYVHQSHVFHWLGSVPSNKRDSYRTFIVIRMMWVCIWEKCVVIR